MALKRLFRPNEAVGSGRASRKARRSAEMNGLVVGTRKPYVGDGPGIGVGARITSELYWVYRTLPYSSIESVRL
ncbi:hypothetical protein D3C73_1572450 [compost metagenome]